MPGEILVSAWRLGRRFGAHCALEEVGFELRRGETLGLLGLNGAGKTTTLRILCGTLAPGSGRVLIAGHDLLAEPLAARRHIGYLPEQPPLYLDSTVDEYLRYCARLRGLRGAALRVALNYGKQACGLEQVGGRLLRNLSKGYRQRAAVAQAVLHRPEVVVLDEPTVGLDPAQIHEIRALVRDLGRAHSVILSTHLIAEVEMLCNRVLILHRGRLRLDLPLYEKPGSAWRVCFRRLPDAAALRAVPGVARVEAAAGEGAWQVFPGSDAAPQEVLDTLQRAALEGDWGLHEMAPLRRDLERVFLDLARDEAEPAAA